MTIWNSINNELSNIFSDQKVNYYLINKLLIDYGLDYIGYGNNRICYSNNKNVIKIPRNDFGIHDNTREYFLWKKRYTLKMCPIARCRLMNNGLILVMEKINLNVKGIELPNWTNYIDCCQVGYNRKNKLVAYDYA